MARTATKPLTTSQGTTVGACLGMLDRYSDGIEGKNELHVGMLMCNHAMREAAELLRLLAPDHIHED